MFLRQKGLINTVYFAVLLFIVAPPATAQSIEKIPPEVIDYAAVHGTVLVLVGLNVPWQMESKLSADAVRAQRAAIGMMQDDLIGELAGRHFKIIRRYEKIPGIGLEVGADALAELARSSVVVNVLLDRPGVNTINHEDSHAPQHHMEGGKGGATVSEKVPAQLFNRVARGGTVLVLAGLRAPWQREDNLSEELVALQRKAILDAQSYLVAELAGTEFTVMRLYRKIPGIALRVGLEALQVLERSPAVTNVVPDRPPRRSP